MLHSWAAKARSGKIAENMSYQSSFRTRFGATPRVVRWLVKTVAVVTLGVWAVSAILGHWLGSWTPHNLLALTAGGIKKLFLWQWITYSLVSPGGLNFGSLLSLFFTLFLLWAAGAALVERVGAKSFIKLLITCTLAAGLFGWLAMLITPTEYCLAGASAVCYGLLAAWAMHAPTQRVVIFLFAQVQMRWLVTILVGFSLLGALGDEQYVMASAYGGAILAAYFYGLLAWNLAGPFKFTRRFDETVAQLGVRWRKWRHGGATKPGKVYDIKDAQVLENDRSAQTRREKFHAWESSHD